MVTPSENTPHVSVDQLQVGMYIYLDLGWMDHPFSFNNFKLRTEQQLDTVRSLGLKQVRWDPARSDVKPLPPRSAAAAKPPAPPPPSEEDLKQQAAKRERMERLREQRERIAKVERAFADASSTIHAINKEIYARPAETIAKASALVKQMVDALLTAPDVAIQVMSGKAGEDIYVHSLNVMVLSMMIGRQIGLPAEAVSLLGVGALFHDIGLSEIPSKIQLKTEALTRVEREVRESHCRIGTEIAAKVGLSRAVQTLIFQHHEYSDGTGYPQGLKGEAIDPLARLLVLANHYDNLCNPPSIAAAVTPHEALSSMFAQHRSRFDLKLLQQFIHLLGVFPPGTVVKLSNDVTGMVVSINPAKPLKPSILIYDPQIPKNEAMILDLESEPDITISRAIRPSQLPPAIYDYLSPRKRVSYYFDAGSHDPAHTP